MAYSNQKLKKSEVLEAIKNGAILRKHYGVYSYWDLTFVDGTRHFNLRNDATNNLSGHKDLEVIDRTKEGYSYKYKTN